MKMADTEKAEEFADSETPPEHPTEGSAAACVAGAGQDEPVKTETTSPSEKEVGSPLQSEPSLLSMPCLLMELRRDSPESQQASTESEKQPSSGRAYESDSSNPCMLSPSSSGHLADSDTLSSGDEAASARAGGDGGAVEEGDPSAAAGGPAAAGARKSRRLRSESEMSSAMAAKKNRCQPSGAEKQPNGRLAKVKGHQSQKHKERMRLLRQKREAAARKKYNLLQDSSTSDSDLTCDSSTSSSDDDDEVSGSSKTITTNIPAGFGRAEGSSGVTSQIQGLLDSGAAWDRNSIGNVLEEAMTRFAVMQRQTEERFRVWMEKLTRLDSDEDSSKNSSDPREPRRHSGRQRGPRPSPPSSFLPSSESQETLASYGITRQNVAVVPIPLNNNPPEMISQNGNPSGEDPNLLNI
ncbi:uncharacterized protein C18orf25 homolog isoform X2 [Anguilla anguilla]|uniref:uncharacterized protein C18orf25 homolog isoform X2 n=1 Tax=Anguilla anguilla TaxID=7936 RepID=UPI0015AA4061|nr:uncharacterized protein C18orf25 homolog isoform X2 [Anguilla anguilla]